MLNDGTCTTAQVKLLREKQGSCSSIENKPRVRRLRVGVVHELEIYFLFLFGGISMPKIILGRDMI